MFDVLMPVSILGTLGASVYFFTKVLTDYILKKKMIEKGFVNEESQSVFKQHEAVDNKYGSLKWGLLALFGGLSLIIMEALQVQPDSPLPYGLFIVSLSFAFLIYYFIVKKEIK